MIFILCLIKIKDPLFLLLFVYNHNKGTFYWRNISLIFVNFLSEDMRDIITGNHKEVQTMRYHAEGGGKRMVVETLRHLKPNMGHKKKSRRHRDASKCCRCDGTDLGCELGAREIGWL